MAENKNSSLNKSQLAPLKSESSGIHQQQTITAIPMPQQQNVFGPSQTQPPQLQQQVQQQTQALSSIPLRPSMISQSDPFTEGAQTTNTITNLTKTLPTNIHSEQQQYQQMPFYPMQFSQMMPMPQFMPYQQQQNTGQGEGQNPMMNMMMPPGLPFNQMPMMPPMNNLAGMDPNQNMMMDQNMMQFQLQQQIQSIQMMQASIMQLGQQFQQQDFQIPQQQEGPSNNNSKRPSTMSGVTNMSQMQNDNVSAAQPFPYKQIGNQNRPNMVPSIDMQKLQEQQAMMASMPSNNSKSVTPGGHTNLSQFSASHMMNQPIQFDLTQGQLSQMNGVNQRNLNNMRQLQQNSQSIEESPMNKFSRDSQNHLSSSKKFSGNKNHQKNKDEINESPNQYELSSKKNSSETVGLLGVNQSSSKQYNLSPDGQDTQLKQIQEQEALTSEDEENLNASNNHPKNNSKMPAFDSSPINEDDEYDKIQYQPTPQFIHDQKLQGGLSARGLDRRVSQGSVANQGTAKRLVSGESMQTILKVPGGMSRKKVQEVDIDGELVSKVSKANLTGNAQPYYPGEVEQNPMNIEFHNELDEFLMDQEEELPKIDDSKENFVNILKQSNPSTNLQIEQIQSASKITNTKELKELDGLVMDKSTKLIDLDQHLEKSKDSLRLPLPQPPKGSQATTSRETLSQQNKSSPREQRSQYRLKEKSKFNRLRVDIGKKSEDSNSDQDQSANLLRHDRSLSSHKFSEYNEDIFQANIKFSGSRNVMEQYLNLQDSKKSLKSRKSKNFKATSPSNLDFNELVDKQSIASKRLKKDHLVQVKSESSSSELQHMQSIAIIEPTPTTPDQLTISKYNSAQPSKPNMKQREDQQKSSPENPQTIQSSRRSYSVGQSFYHKELPKIDIDMVESQKSKELRSSTKKDANFKLQLDIDNQQSKQRNINVHNTKKEQQNISIKLGVIKEQTTTDMKESPGEDDNKKQLEFLLQQIQIMQSKAEELQQRLGVNDKDVSKPALGLGQQQYSQSSLFAGLKDSSPESKSPSKIMQIKNTILPPSTMKSPAINKKLIKSTTKISSEGSTIGIQNQKKLAQKYNSQSYQQMNTRKTGDQSYEISESINISNGAELFQQATNKMASIKQKVPDQIKEIESEKNSSEYPKSGWKNSVVMQPKLKLKNTASTQNLPTPQDSQQQRNSVISSAEQTPVQTYRPDLKTCEKLQNEDKYAYVPQSKSYNKDEVLLQLISAEQTYQKNNLIKNQIAKTNMQLTKPRNMKHPQLIEGMDLLHDADEENLSPTTLEVDHRIRPQIKIIRRHVDQEKDKNEVVNRKFNKIFGSIFRGYNRKMLYKFEEKKFQVQQMANKKNQDWILKDFDDVIQYTICVNRNVCQALRKGVFQRTNFVGNLMREEDHYFFDEQKILSPIVQKTQTDQTETQFDITEILKIQNIQLKNELLQKHLDNRARKQILLTNQDLIGDFTTLQFRDFSSLNVSVKHLFIDNKKRRQRLEAKKKHAEVLLKEERDKYMHQHQERQLKIEVDKLERKEKVQMRIRKMSLERQFKHRMWKEQRRVHSSLVNQKPLFKRLEENLKIQEEKYEESREEYLKARRTKFKPIIKEQLEDFAEKIDIIAGHLSMKKKEERSKQKEKNDSFDPNRLKSKIYENVVSQDKLSKQQGDLEFKKKSELIARKHNYSKYIKMVHLPSANEQKQAELKSRIENLKHPVKSQFKHPPGMTLAQLSERSGMNLEGEFMSRRNSGQISLRKNNSRNSKSQQPLPLILSVDNPVSKEQKQKQTKPLKQLNQNKSHQLILVTEQKEVNSQGGLAHLEQYEENIFIKKRNSLSKQKSEKGDEKKKDYLQEFREQRQSKQQKVKKEKKESSALEKLKQLEKDVESDKFSDNYQEQKEDRWI